MRRMKKVYRMISLALVLALVVGNEGNVAFVSAVEDMVSGNQSSVSEADVPEDTEQSEAEDESVNIGEIPDRNIQTGNVVGGDCGAQGDNLKWSLDLDTGVLTISGSGEMENYSCEYVNGEVILNTSTAPWFEYKDVMNTIVLLEGLTSIGEKAFLSCSGFGGELRLPEGLTSIGAEAFKGCSGFSGELRLPEGLTSIGAFAFEGCSGFSGELRLPEGLTSIAWKAFNGCSGFSGELRLPEGLTSIELAAFNGCSGFSGELRLPEGLISIEGGAFNGCSGFSGELRLPEGLTSIGDYAFDSCSGFSGELRLPEGLTSIGEWSFYNCSGFSGELRLPKGLTSIGLEAFGYCSGFSGELRLPEGLTSIESAAFSGCSGFSGELRLPEGLTSIEGHAFFDCSGFKGDLTIPENVSQIGEGAFSDCSGLEGYKVYLGSNISYIGIGAFHRTHWEWADETLNDGKTIIDGPLNITIVCPANSYAEKWATENGFKVQTINETIDSSSYHLGGDKAGIVVFDRGTRKVIKNAVITDGAEQYTDAEVIAVPVAGDQPERKKLTISAEGYYSVSKSVKLQKGRITHVDLLAQNDTNTFGILSAGAVCAGRDYDLLSEKLSLAYIPDAYSDEDASVGNVLEETAVILVEAAGDIVNYELLQDGKVIDSDSKGQLEFKVVTHVDDTEYFVPVTTKLVNGKPVTLRITDRQGNQDTKELGIKISRNFYTNAEKQVQEGNLTIGKKIKMKIPEDIPLVGGGTIDLGFDDDFIAPVEIEVEESGKVRVSFNKEPDIPLNEYEEIYKGLSKRAERNSNKIKNNLGGAVKRFKAGYFSAEGKVCGYGEGNISELETGSFTVKLGLLAEIEGKGGYKQYFFVGFVPINIFVEGSVSCKPELEGSLTFKNWKINGFDLTGGGMNIKVGLTGGGGVGAGLEVNASLSGSANYQIKPARNYQKLWLEASGKVSVSVGWFEKVLWKSKKYTRVLYESGFNKKTASLGANQEKAESAQFQQMDRTYLAYREQGRGRFAMSMETKAENPERTIIKPAVYPSAGVRLVSAGGRQYLFWMDDILARSANNRAALVYAVSEDGLRWSEPVQLVPETENATPDLGYDVYAQGDKIYILWQDGTRILSEEEDVLAMAESMGIRTAVLDTANDSVTAGSMITEQPAYYMHPGIFAHGTDTYACFVENLLESRDIAGNNTHLLWYSKNGGEPEKRELPQKCQIVNMDLGWFGEQCCAVCEADTDGDLTTDSDREILAVSLETGEQKWLTDDTVCDAYPQISDSGILYWNSGNAIVSMAEPDGELWQVTEEAGLDHAAFFTTVTTPEGRDQILFAGSDTEENNTLAVYGIRQTEDRGYGGIVRHTQIKGSILPGLTAVYGGGQLLVGLLEGDFLEDGGLLKDLCVYRTGGRTDLLAGVVTYDEKAAAPGSLLPLQVWVKNQGSAIIQNADVRINDMPVASFENLALQPGEERELTVEGYILPENLSGPAEYTLSVDVDQDACPEDNRTVFGVGYPDFAVSASVRFFEGHNWIDVMVSNENRFASGGILKVHKDAPDGEVIFETGLKNITKEISVGQTVSLEAYDSQCMNYYVEAVCDTEENNLGNNDTLVYVGYGTGVESLPAQTEPVVITSLVLEPENMTMRVGDTAQLSVKTVPETESGAGEILWTSSNPNVADVDENGAVTAKKPGSAVITASWEDLSAECNVTVHADSLEPITILFDTQNSRRLEPVTGIMPGSTAKLPEPAADGNQIFMGWYTLPEGGEPVTEEYIFYSSVTLYAHWQEAMEGLWVLELPQETYSGAAIKPKPVVYDHAVRLTEGKDYTLSYKNNKKPNDASDQAKAPAVIIKGKGNYTGSVTAVFSILPKNLEDTDILTEDLTVVCNGKLQKPVPKVTRNGKKLKNKTDFILEYPDTADGAYKLPGVYTIKIKAKQGGGYAGERTVNLTILPETSVPVSKLTVARIPAAAYKEGVPAEPSLTVKYKGKKLEQGVDYTVTYQDNEQAGTAKAVLTGLNGSDYSYMGTRTITFKITGTPISRARITVRTGEGFEYDGTVIKPAVTVTASAGGQETTLRENTDYTIEYGANAKAGKGTVRIKGMGGYTGTVKKTFTIKPYSINKDKITVANRDTLTAVYEKAGARPEIRLYFDGKELTAGTDYTISCKNNKKTAGREESKAPTVTVRGKDNFTGSLSLPFEITKKSLAQDIPNAVVITAADVTLNSKGNYRAKLTVRDAAGKKLTEKKDYTVTGYYLDDGSGRELPAKAELTPGTVLKAVLQGTGNYCGTAEVSYRVTGNSLAKVSFKISPQTYTGEEIRFTEEDMNNPQILKVSAGKGKTPPVYGTDYIITGYSHNREKGKASVTFKGISDAWGGSRTVTFRITSKKMKWFWDLLG